MLFTIAKHIHSCYLKLIQKQLLQASSCPFIQLKKILKYCILKDFLIHCSFLPDF